ncbi:hypothetical protein [Aliiglaciecola lipolytica]|uniref:Uncharacterized protein n=1 Tax=Aliiglaciecola lipolytica E3 TaxID=1127673 RepID=K6YK26_9ALTE|nr:hypothetical protein [Aliiglaciecola lipolytica]GAC16963.1 hypothetical protein GLIP_4352 [Aliiglaciecola lipolytica E3]
MSDIELPDSISNLAGKLQIVEIVWQGVPFQIPKFAVYSILDNPVFDRFMYRNGRRIALLKLGRYEIPVIDPFRGNIDKPPEHVVIITHSKEDRFGLYGYPADHVADDLIVASNHRSVKCIVKDFV